MCVWEARGGEICNWAIILGASIPGRGMLIEASNWSRLAELSQVAQPSLRLEKPGGSRV